MRDIAEWWLGFMVLTIAAERLELSRRLALTRISQVAFALAVALILVGAGRDEFAALPAIFSGVRIPGLGSVARSL